MQVSIREDDLKGREIAALIQKHLEHGAANSPPESVHALDVAALRTPDVTFWSAWDGGDLLGCGALKEIDKSHGELKSMHTAARSRGRGVGARILEHVIAQARRRGYRHLSLETGSTEAYAPARALYARFGFELCPPFGSYREDPYSVYMTLDLTA